MYQLRAGHPSVGVRSALGLLAVAVVVALAWVGLSWQPVRPPVPASASAPVAAGQLRLVTAARDGAVVTVAVPAGLPAIEPTTVLPPAPRVLPDELLIGAAAALALVGAGLGTRRVATRRVGMRRVGTA